MVFFLVVISVALPTSEELPSTTVATLSECSDLHHVLLNNSNVTFITDGGRQNVTDIFVDKTLGKQHGSDI